jgi:hypothetical protein
MMKADRLYHGTHSGVSAQVEAEGLKARQNEMGGCACPCVTDSLEAAKGYAGSRAEEEGTSPVVYEVIVPDPTKLFEDTYHDEVGPGHGWEHDGDIPATSLHRIGDAELQAVQAQTRPLTMPCFP